MIGLGAEEGNPVVVRVGQTIISCSV